MTETTSRRRRGHGEDAIYFATAKDRWVGSVSLGYGPDGKRIRRKVFGKTKQEVRDRLKALHQEMDSGVAALDGASRELVDVLAAADAALNHARGNRP